MTSDIAVYPGSFDPPTYGHVDIVKRAAALWSHVVIGVGANAVKNNVFTPDERVRLWTQICEDEGLSNVTVAVMEGLTVDFCRDHHASLLVKGVRNGADVTGEIVQASVNYQLSSIETVLLPCRGEFMHISSTIVKDIAHYHGDVSALVPPVVADYLQRVMAKQ